MFRIKFKPALIVLIVAILAFGAYIGVTSVKADKHDPQITCDSDMISISIKDDDSVLLQGVTASDAEDGDLTGDIIIESISKFYDTGKFRVTYAVADSANHVAKRTRSVEYTDYVSPTFNLSQELVFNYGYVFDLKDYISVNDCIDGNISSKVKTILVGNASSIYNVGVWSVRAEVTNSMGDTESVTLDVTVKNADPGIPVIKLSEYLVYIDLNQTFNPLGYVSSVTVGDDEKTDSETLNQVKVDTDLDTDVSGEYTVTFTYFGSDMTKAGTTQMTVVVGNGKAEDTTDTGVFYDGEVLNPDLDTTASK